MRLANIAILLIGLIVASCGSALPWEKPQPPQKPAPTPVVYTPKKVVPAAENPDCKALRAELAEIAGQTKEVNKGVIAGVGGLVTPIIVYTTTPDSMLRRQKEIREQMSQKKCT